MTRELKNKAIIIKGKTHLNKKVNLKYFKKGLNDKTDMIKKRIKVRNIAIKKKHTEIKEHLWQYIDRYL